MACFQHKSYTNLDCVLCVEVEHMTYDRIKVVSQAANKESGFLNAKDLSKIQQTRELIKSGKPLFDGIDTHPIKTEKARRVVREITTEELKAKEQRWKDGVEVGSRTGVTFDMNNPNSPNWFPPVDLTKLPPPNILTCSFCQKPVESSNATIGRGKLKFKRRQEARQQGDHVVTVEVVRATSAKLVACPNCCLKIEPKKDDDGSIIHSNVVTYTEG